MARGGSRPTVALLGLALAASALAGCSGDDSSSSPSPPSPQGSGAHTTSVQGNRDLPPNYPSSEAPVLPGRVVGIRQGKVDGHDRWQVLIATPKTPEAALTQASQLLTQAGWTAGTSHGNSQQLTRGDGESVALTAGAKHGKTGLFYVVTLG